MAFGINLLSMRVRCIPRARDWRIGRMNWSGGLKTKYLCTCTTSIKVKAIYQFGLNNAHRYPQKVPFKIFCLCCDAWLFW